MSSGKRVVRMKDASKKLGRCVSGIYKMLDPKSPYFDPSFPRTIRLSQNSVGFYEDELDTWLESRPRTVASDSPARRAA